MKRREAFINILKFFSPTPGMTVISVLALVLGGSIYLRSRGGPQLDPQVTQEELQRGPAPAAERASLKPVEAFGAEDPAVRYAERLREASALTMAFSLYALNERVTNRRVIPTVNAALAGLANSPLMPPGLRVASAGGVVSSGMGLYYVRYRPNPFGVEVLSCGARGASDGAIFLLRLPESAVPASAALPAGRGVSSGAALFVAPAGDAPVLAPFAPAPLFGRAGWSLEPLRSNPLTPEQWADMQAWLSRTLKENPAGG